MNPSGQDDSKSAQIRGENSGVAKHCMACKQRAAMQRMALGLGLQL